MEKRKERDIRSATRKRNDALRMRGFVDFLMQTGRAGGGGPQRDYTSVFLNTVVKEIPEED